MASYSCYFYALFVLSLTVVEAIKVGSIAQEEEKADPGFRKVWLKQSVQAFATLSCVFHQSKVSNYFMVRESARVRLRCESIRSVEVGKGGDGDAVLIARNFTWAFVPKGGENEIPVALEDGSLARRLAGGRLAAVLLEEEKCATSKEYGVSSCLVACHSP